MKMLLPALALAAGLATAHAQAAPTASPAPPPLAPAIAAVMHTGNADTLATLATQLARIAAQNPTDWLSRYYQAYALVISTFTTKKNRAAKDGMLGQAEAALEQARQLKGDESELLALQAYLYQARLRVAPARRSARCAAQVAEAVVQAENLNPANPRPYLVAANQVYYTPAMFGGGAAKARPLYEVAQAKYAAFTPAGPLLPSWGEYQLQTLRRACEPATNAAPGHR